MITPGGALHELSIAEAGRLLRSGQLSSVALTEYALDRIAALDPDLNAFVLLTRDRALGLAESADRALAAGRDMGPFHGVPYALKDNYDVAGLPTTCHSKLLLENVPTMDSDVEARLRAGGGVLLGKLAMHEFATSWPSFDLPFPPARNPWNRDHIPGGSSSGSGVAVAAGFVRMAMGTDTGGSIRWPATYCGAVGLKPTRGLVSCRGVFPLSETLDHCGPLTWTIEDAALTLGAIAGVDTIGGKEAEPKWGGDLSGLRLALPRRLYADAPHASPEIIAAIDAAAQEFARLGADIDEVGLPDHDLINACGRVIMMAESFALHERDMRRRPDDYAPYTYRRIAPGAFLAADDYSRARQSRRELERDLNAGILATRHAILTATVLTPPPRFDAYTAEGGPPMPIQTILANVTGNPALAFPIGLSKAGFPMGAQLIGRQFGEATLFRLAAAYETAAGAKPRPCLSKDGPFMEHGSGQ
jgi:aspartyl-tRNA(Asn)/glutamyl-tRNA(Gln) amidotransferase subunit A